MLVVGAIGLVIVLTTAGLHLGSAAAAAHRARAAADLSALAAAAAIQSGVVRPCARAAALAHRNAARLVRCTVVGGEIVELRVSARTALSWPGVPTTATASARAGPAAASPVGR
ncbi:hypothetical protein N801_03890 [Knoellia aerolata DSM 18566]|uniref:Uncharacterized protein n=1 Tax=Knoellia aerolata DSM 18566 TaxID=1385519 RepID=A0A0A0K208_9MICO|nr:hypothetical protein N801_03890 [Knoellia aerolata DSM 18566]